MAAMSPSHLASLRSWRRHDWCAGYATIFNRKDMIMTAGFNVYPAELERVLCMHPAVALYFALGYAASG